MFEAIEQFIGQSDPRMAEYPLMNSIHLTVVFSGLYLLFIKVIGPQMMKSREPYSLRHLMIVYNIFLVIVNLWICTTIVTSGWLTTYNWRCEPIDTSRDPIPMRVVLACWVFYISKIMEYTDTIIFVLRKKQSQINFLHVFHHSTVPITAWLGVSYGPGGYNTIFPIANTFVHVWMYLYYGLAAIGPEVQKYLWWKKYLTRLQLVQFVFVYLYFLQLALFAPESCKVSPFLIWISLGQAIIYFGLFLNFYWKSYRRKIPKQDIEDNLKHENGHVIAKHKGE